MSKGGKNLLILGGSAILVALFTTATALIFYKTSGDIYLDRSRPGYLPDEKEVENEENTKEGNYSFSQNGEITEEILTEFLEKLQIEIDAIDTYSEAFSDTALSDERLGI